MIAIIFVLYAFNLFLASLMWRFCMIFSIKTDIKNEDSNSKKYDRFAINKDIKSLFNIIKTLVAKVSNSKIIKCLIILLLNLNFIILFLKGSTK